MLALFAAFYIFFPIILGLMLSYSSQATLNPQVCLSTSAACLTPTKSDTCSILSCSVAIAASELWGGGSTSKSLSGLISDLTFVDNYAGDIAGLFIGIPTYTCPVPGQTSVTQSTPCSGGGGTVSYMNVVSYLITEVIERIFYTVFAFILSLILTYDFMETLSDLLGAPSLRSNTMLKNVI